MMKHKLSYSDDREMAFYFGATFKMIDGGYYRCLQRNHARGYLLHRFIYETETESKIPDGYSVHHKDSNKANNDIENLECVKLSAHAKLHNTPEKIKKCVDAMKQANKERNYPGCRASHAVQKENNYPSLRESNKKKRKPILMYTSDMRLLKRFGSLLEAAKYIGKPPTHISQCANMNRNTAFGFIWRWDNG